MARRATYSWERDELDEERGSKASRPGGYKKAEVTPDPNKKSRAKKVLPAGGSAQAALSLVNKGRKQNQSPSSPSGKKRVTVAVPGSKEARKMMAAGVVKDIRKAVSERDTETFKPNGQVAGGAARAPRYTSNSMGAKSGSRATTIAPDSGERRAESNIAVPADHDEKQGAYKRFLPGGRDNPIFRPGHDADEVASGTFAGVRNKITGAANRFTAAHLSGDRAARESVRQEFHSHVAQLQKQSGRSGGSISGPCSTPNCTRTTETGGSCPNGTCKIDSPAMAVASRPRE